MRVKKSPSVSNVDLGGATAALVIAAAGVLLWVRPAIENRQTYGAQRSEYAAVTHDLADTEARRETVRVEAQSAQAALAASGGGPPSTRALDAGIKRLLGIAERTELEVEELRSSGHRVLEKWQEYQFELRVRCGFPAFHRFCRTLENELRFVEMPTYSIQREDDPSRSSPATMTCTVRFYFRSES